MNKAIQYKTLESFVRDAVDGITTCEVMVGDDFVTAYEGETQVFNFNGNLPDKVLVDVLSELGVKVVHIDAA